IYDILQAIAACSPVSADIRQIGRDWGFQEMCRAACADSFQTQRALETASLVRLLSLYRAELDPMRLSERLFAYWLAPDVYEAATWFLRNNTLPVCIVSNIDTSDLLAASTH